MKECPKCGYCEDDSDDMEMQDMPKHKPDFDRSSVKGDVLKDLLSFLSDATAERLPKKGKGAMLIEVVAAKPKSDEDDEFKL